MKLVDKELGIELFKKLGNDAIPLLDHYGDDLLKYYKIDGTKLVNVLSTDFGTEAAELIIKHGKESLDLIAYGTETVIKGTKFADSLVPAKYTNAQDFVKQGQVLLSNPPFNRLTTGFTSGNYRENLRRLYGWAPKGKYPDGTLFNAHHIFPQDIFDDQGLGPALKKAGISIHDPRLMVWWEQSDHLIKQGSITMNGRFSLKTIRMQPLIR